MSAEALAEAVDALTKPTTTKYLQSNEAGITCLSEVAHDSRLHALDEAIAGNIGSHAGGSDVTGRMPINADAVTLYQTIERVVNRWTLDGFGRLPGVRAVYAVRVWHDEYAAPLLRESEEPELLAEAWLRDLRRWARQIDDLFDPPKRMELTSTTRVPVRNSDTGEPVTRSNGEPVMRSVTAPIPCPHCEEARAYEPTTGNLVTALTIEYRTSQAEDALSAAVARCRSCEDVWPGESGITLLRAEIDEAEYQMTPELGSQV